MRQYKESLINKLPHENFVNIDGFQIFCDISLETLDKHAPLKIKYAWSNQMPFFNKDLSKAIMTRTTKNSQQNKSEEK